MAVYLGMNLLHNQAPADKRSDTDIMLAIKAQAKLVNDTSAQQHISFGDAIKELEEQQKLPDLLSASDKLSAAEDLEQIHILNNLLCDMSIRTVESDYEHQLDIDKGISKAQRDVLELQSQMIVADTLVKAAAQRKDMNRIAQASGIVLPLARTYDSKPVWQDPVAVGPTKEFPAFQVTPATLT